ncbi:MAG TPA: AAA family ATPase [Vicinamibacterales bacterium]|nr:AAA family ATPase [Vicinamibacterales bacterium]
MSDPHDLQRDVIAWLASPAAHDGQPVERIDTHSAVVFLAGDRALKLKRAVKYDYLDFSTLDLRREACNAEVRLNRRAAPSIYRGAVAVTADAGGSFALDGPGPAVDWLVEMSRFDQDALFDRLASRGALPPDLMATLGSTIATFHRDAARRVDQGGVAGLRWVIEGNARSFKREGQGILDPGAAGDLTSASLAEVDRQAERLERRRRDGFVRQCHGDLHLRNLVLIDGRPTLFDAVEFNDAIACGDVYYDLAFLLMDLWRRDLREQANVVLNAYVADTDDVDGLALLPLFLSCRAAVRAKTSATASRLQPALAGRREFEDLAREYLRLAAALLRRPRPGIVAIGGFSGSGKSTMARALAPDVGGPPGAIVLRSDLIRKEICGVPAHERLGPDGYSADITRRVYTLLADRAAAIVHSGHAAIVDAVYAESGSRRGIEAVATAAGADFIGLWLEAPGDVLVARVRTRTGDASDADEAVVRRQTGQNPGAMTWRRVNAAGSAPETLARVRQAVGRPAPGDSAKSPASACDAASE